MIIANLTTTLHSPFLPASLLLDIWKSGPHVYTEGVCVCVCKCDVHACHCVYVHGRAHACFLLYNPILVSDSDTYSHCNSTCFFQKIHLQVDSAYYSGDVLGAQSASRSAWNWNIAGIIFGSVALVVVTVIISIIY